VDLSGKTVSVGRLPECTISIDDSNISRNHAQVRAGASNYLVTDLGSTNGTMVNGVKIVGDHALRDGDIISFGSTHVRFEAS
jgi:pSer/pThr/pTyr-binding forkhead associated (FHA) protein